MNAGAKLSMLLEGIGKLLDELSDVLRDLNGCSTGSTTTKRRWAR